MKRQFPLHIMYDTQLVYIDQFYIRMTLSLRFNVILLLADFYFLLTGSLDGF